MTSTYHPAPWEQLEDSSLMPNNSTNRPYETSGFLRVEQNLSQFLAAKIHQNKEALPHMDIAGLNKLVAQWVSEHPSESRPWNPANSDPQYDWTINSKEINLPLYKSIFQHILNENPESADHFEKTFSVSTGNDSYFVELKAKNPQNANRNRSECYYLEWILQEKTQQYPDVSFMVSWQ